MSAGDPRTVFEFDPRHPVTVGVVAQAAQEQETEAAA